MINNFLVALLGSFILSFLLILVLFITVVGVGIHVFG